MNKILIIEDQINISRLVKVILEKQGFKTLQAFSGKDGIELAKKEMPDLIILDVMMPNMDGFEVAKALTQSKNPAPIIMLSSAAQFKDKIKGLKSGAADYLTKPFDKNELLEKVNKHLQNA